MRSPGTPVSAFSPVQVGPLKLRNRFVKSATNEGMANGGVPSKRLVEHHRRIAAGGVGMTTVAYCAISRRHERRVAVADFRQPHAEDRGRPGARPLRGRRVAAGCSGGAKSLAGVQQAMAEGFDCVAMGRALTCNECVAMTYSPLGTHCVLHHEH